MNVMDTTTNETPRSISASEANGKPVHSKDPRKAPAMAALKAASGCRKVTMVEELRDGGFSGNCMNGGNPGFWFVPAHAAGCDRNDCRNHDGPCSEVHS